MKPSFLRLVVRAVLACWLGGFAILVTYSSMQTWTEDRAERDGVFLAVDLLERTSPPEREATLQRLQPNFNAPFALLTPDEAETRLGQPVSPGDRTPLHVSMSEAWWFVGLQDGSAVLAAGPVHPSMPPDAVPVGLFLAIIAIPLIAGIIMLRVGRELTKVERASAALAAGELGARVDNPDGPSKELAASFNAMAKRIEELIRSRDELIQAISHELGSPLSRLRFQLALLESPGADERADERVAAMQAELDALEELVAELLSYVQSDESKLELQSFNAARGLRDLAELARLDAEERPLDVSVDLPDEAVIRADPRLFLRAIENLLRNAIRHAKGTVRIEFSSDDERVQVEVHDDGPGIPEAIRDKVTAPFFRAEPDRGRMTGGTGLGLAIVERIVERHGGSLSIGESPLGGARVTTRWLRT
ncbi:MAG: ATP-binding protein [Myxococcota bacterium]